MIKFIDDFLNRTTMYRLVLYVLLFLLLGAFCLSFFGFLPYTPTDLIASVGIIMAVSWAVNVLFARVFEAPTNVESVYITALILILIITPPQGGDYSQFLSLGCWAAVWAMASKYILAIRKKHIFNPAAFAVALTTFTIGESASWWVGTVYMLPLVAVGGFLIVRKIRRTDLVLGFFMVALISTIGFGLARGTDPLTSLYKAFTHSPILFFAVIMLTEPLTTPPTRMLRVLYGIIVGALFSPSMHIGSLYSTPEIALLVGNAFVFLVSPKEKLILKLKEKVKVAADTYDFVFSSDRTFSFKSGQYMEWTLAHRDPDSRGNRRYFTIASSPAEPDVRAGIKMYPQPSSFKNRLAAMKEGDVIVASQRAGDFVLPEDKERRLVFIAGGIGVTPFRSMIRHMLDIGERRPVTLLYANKTVGDIAYRDIFDRAEKELGVKTVYAVDAAQDVSGDHSVRRGFIDAAMIEEEVPRYKECTFYISGPHGMVTAFGATLKKMGVRKHNIKTDFFPGFA